MSFTVRRLPNWIQQWFRTFPSRWVQDAQSVNSFAPGDCKVDLRPQHTPLGGQWLGGQRHKTNGWNLKFDLGKRFTSFYNILLSGLVLGESCLEIFGAAIFLEGVAVCLSSVFFGDAGPYRFQLRNAYKWWLGRIMAYLLVWEQSKPSDPDMLQLGSQIPHDHFEL